LFSGIDSVVDRSVHTRDVNGSIPFPATKFYAEKATLVNARV
jgi:hypothetical protein